MFGVYRNYWVEDFYECWRMLGYVTSQEAGEAYVAHLKAEAEKKRSAFRAEMARYDQVSAKLKEWSDAHPRPTVYDRRTPAPGTPPKPIRTPVVQHEADETKEKKRQINEHNRGIENSNRIRFEEWYAIVDAANEIANQPYIVWNRAHDEAANGIAFNFGYEEYPSYPSDDGIDDVETKYDIRPLKELKVE